MNEPGTLKVTKIEDHKPQPTATHTISFTLEGFSVSTTVEGTADVLRAVIQKLKTIGAQPVGVKAAQPLNEDAPVCEYHGAMKPSKFGGYFCPKKMGDGSHCKSKA